MKPLRSITAAFAAIVIAGCATAPKTRYYTVNMTPSGSVASRYHLEVERFRVAEALAKRSLLVKKSPTELEYYATDEWIASLDEIVAEKLESEFGSEANNRPVLAISGEILAFQQEDTPGGAIAHLKATIEFRPDSGRRYGDPLATKLYEIRVPASEPHPNAVVEALGRGLEQLAAAIAADANRIELPSETGQAK